MTPRPLLPLAIFLIAFSQIQETYQDLVRAFETDTAERLRAEAGALTEAGEVEAAQVFADIAAWLQPGEKTLGEAALALAACVQLIDKAPRRRPEPLEAAAARTSDARREGFYARVPAATRVSRMARSSLAIGFPGERMIVNSLTAKSEIDPVAPPDVLPPVRIVVSDDEIMIIEDSRVTPHFKTDSVLRADADVPARQARKLALKAPGRTAGSVRLFVAAEMLGSIRSIVRALHRLNDHRLAAGLRPVPFSAERSVGCFLHARYLALETRERTSDSQVHVEAADSKFRTAEGETAGRRGLIAKQFADYSVDGFVATLYHRTPLLHPGLDRVGIGRWTQYCEPWCVIDPALAGAEEGLVRFPGHGDRQVLTRFAPAEVPNPLPLGAPPAGYPVTLTFYGGAIPSGIRASLVESKTQKPVDCHVSSPEAPANATRPENARSVCLIPKAPLKPATGYTVEILGKDASGERTWSWSFQTLEGPLAW